MLSGHSPAISFSSQRLLALKLYTISSLVVLSNFWVRFSPIGVYPETDFKQLLALNSRWLLIVLLTSTDQRLAEPQCALATESNMKVIAFLHNADGLDWQSPSKGTSLKTLQEAEKNGFITIRGEFQQRQFRLTELGSQYVERDKRRLQARRL